ncbi:hypothetical protein ACJ73_07429 [Blastomyces percursus]|uniref:Uncharacterized protein n=1 Tax=Blastomyces percursus TaxID=1658174 RepID=A0A1J9QLZ4_9EURO|nr:hypothetical protein ACJ73_07429 [Blastomyces percursus]
MEAAMTPLDLGGVGRIPDVESLQATQPPEATNYLSTEAHALDSLGASTRPEAQFLAPFRQEIEDNLKAYARGLEQALRAEFETIREQLGTSIAALEKRVLDLETQTNTRLETLEAIRTPSSSPDHPLEQQENPIRTQRP